MRRYLVAPILPGGVEPLLQFPAILRIRLVVSA